MTRKTLSTLIPVEALIQHRSGIASARLFWRLAEGDGIQRSRHGPKAWTTCGMQPFPHKPRAQMCNTTSKALRSAARCKTAPCLLRRATGSSEWERLWSMDSTMPPGLPGSNPPFPIPPRPSPVFQWCSRRSASGRLILRDAAGRLVHTVFEGAMPSGNGPSTFWMPLPFPLAPMCCTLEVEGRGTVVAALDGSLIGPYTL